MRNNIAIFFVSSVFISFSSMADDHGSFDISLLVSDMLGKDIDVTALMKKGGGVEGEREVSIFINNSFYSQKSLYFSNTPDGLLPVFPVGFFDGLLLRDYQSKISDKKVLSFELLDFLPQSSIKFNQGLNRIDLSIPQAYLSKKSLLKSDPESWDTGVTALLMDYRINGQNMRYRNSSSQTMYLSSILGVNVAGWRLRTSGNYNYYETQKNRSYSSSVNNYWAERDIPSLRSSLRVGRSLYTGGRILDSIPYNGLKLYSNNEMLSPHQRNYSPVVRGVANTNAVITIKQHGKTVYQTNVPPGPFALNDLSISGYTGDLKVIVKEADGSEREFIQSFSTLSEMKREGVSDFELSAGLYDNIGSNEYYDDTMFMYGSWARGFSHGVTAFGELVFSNRYYSLGLGSTLSLGTLGAASADVTISRADKNSESVTGQSYGLKYSKSQLETGSTITLAAYRYSTRDFIQFGDFVSKNSLSYYKYNTRQKNKISVSLNQTLGNYGSLYFDASQQDYWDSDRKNNYLSASHTFNWRGYSFNTTFSLDRLFAEEYKNNNKQINFNVSAPLSNFFKGSSNTLGRLSYMANSTNNNVNNTTTLSGIIPDTSLSYQLGTSWGKSYNNSSRNMSLTWNGNNASAALGYIYSSINRNINYSLAGSAIVWPGGIALGRESVTTNGAIVIKTGKESGIKHNRGGETSLFGTALIASPEPYTENRIDLLQDELPDNIVLGKSSASSIPVKGAVTVLNYSVYRGAQIIFKLKRPDGEFIPFGSLVSLDGAEEDTPNTGIVGEDGQVYMAGIPKVGRLKVSTGTRTCYASFNLSLNNNLSNGPISEADIICQKQ
ncbi:fimbria/pilus outer membrane usher protein [Escherichia coli]|uniref:fimbria/pilus outer membrane usher protein n=2 Tax=Escherichia coli TaxID=562 RepID=UPI001FCCE1ED|nr:fimbria/pilus outer membrane usher protein [Escherichia coli]